MNYQLTIKKAIKEDIQTIIQLKIKMFEDAGLVHLLHDDCHNLIYSKYFELYDTGEAIHFLGEIDGEIVSIAGAFLKSDIPYCFYKNKKIGFIGDMYTKKEFRLNGYSSQLLGKVLEWFKDQGVSQIQLLATDEGRHMYEKIGFEPDISSMIYYIK